MTLRSIPAQDTGTVQATGVHYEYYCDKGGFSGSFLWNCRSQKEECSVVPHPASQRAYLKTGLVFLVIFLLPFKTNGKMWASEIYNRVLSYFINENKSKMSSTILQTAALWKTFRKTGAEPNVSLALEFLSREEHPVSKAHMAFANDLHSKSKCDIHYLST